MLAFFFKATVHVGLTLFVVSAFAQSPNIRHPDSATSIFASPMGPKQRSLDPYSGLADTALRGHYKGVPFGTPTRRDAARKHISPLSTSAYAHPTGGAYATYSEARQGEDVTPHSSSYRSNANGAASNYQLRR